MLKFFRKIRQNLLSEGKIATYLKYAVGEIILVVIGIFIAIQLNDWNQERIEKKQYEVVLRNLENEFSRTRELLRRISSEYDISMAANKELMELFTGNYVAIAEQRIDSLLEQCTKQAPFYPPQPVLDELLSSGRIKSMQNEDLKRYLFDWGTTIKWFHFDYDLFINFSNDQFQPYLNKNWSWKNIDIAGGVTFYKERSVLSPDQNELFRQLEFENLVGGNLFHTDRLYRRLKSIDSLIENILREIESSLGHSGDL